MFDKSKVRIKPSRKYAVSQCAAQTAYELRQAAKAYKPPPPPEPAPEPILQIDAYSLTRQPRIDGTWESLPEWADRVLRLAGKASIVSLTYSVKIERANIEMRKRGVKEEDLIVPVRR